MRERFFREGVVCAGERKKNNFKRFYKKGDFVIIFVGKVEKMRY